MREIKFRAWDNVAFQMYYLGEEEDIVFSFESNGIVATDITQEEERFQTLHHLEYMQFTGLHDRNGKEIYEGDICKGKAYGFPNSPKRLIGAVEYRYNRYDIVGVKQYKGLVDELNTTYEVIGNIYENPELLEESK